MAVFGSLLAPGGGSQRTTSTTLRPDYSRMVSSGYALQTAQNRQALEALESGQPSSQQDWLQNYYSQVQQQQTQARSANEQRYQQMLGLADKDREAELAGYGAMKRTIGQETGQRAADIRSETEGQVSDYRQQQARLGMSNVYQPSIVGGIRREGQSNLNRLTDALLGRKLGVQQQIAQRGREPRLGIMERRTDAYPDQSGMLQLIQSMAASGGSTPSFGGGGPMGAPAGSNSALSASQYRSKYG